MRRVGQAWRSRVGIAVLSACLTAMVVFAAGEAYVRATKPYSTPDTLRRQSLEYEATLLSRHAFPRTVQDKRYRNIHPIHINEHGYRGPSFSLRKPAGTIRVVVLGGSAVFDPYAEEGEDWPHLVQKELRAAGHSHLEVINAGVPGHASWDSLGRLYGEIWMLEPDYILVEHAWNDIKYFRTLDPQNSLLRTQRPAPLESSQRGVLIGNPFLYYTGPVDRLLCHSQLYVRLRWRYWSWRFGVIGLEGIISGKKRAPAGGEADTYGPWGPRQLELDLRLLVAAARYIGAVPILATQPRLPVADSSAADRERIKYAYVGLSHAGIVRAFADCDAAVFAAAKAENAAAVDLARALNGESDLFVDHVHLTPKGGRALAREAVKVLEPLLRRRSDERG